MRQFLKEWFWGTLKIFSALLVFVACGICFFGIIAGIVWLAKNVSILLAIPLGLLAISALLSFIWYLNPNE